MEVITPEYSYRGHLVQTAWSPQVAVTEVLFSVRVSQWIFHGIRAINIDSHLWDWPETESLLWVFDDGQSLKLWQGLQQRPRIVEGERRCEVETVIGDYQSMTGNIYIGVKWRGYDCPTWELEEELVQYGYILEQDIE